MRDLDEIALRTWLSNVQARLGTVYEMPNDLQVAQAIAHRLNNLLTLRGVTP
jgi:hypothetical protein